jgi:hypothetical protein
MLGAKRAVFVPYGGDLLSPQFNIDASEADGPRPIRTVGVMMLGAKRAVLTLTAITIAIISRWHVNGWINNILRGHRRKRSSR